jgi:hypothetical protein
MDITNKPRPEQAAEGRDGHSEEARAEEGRALNPTREFYGEIIGVVEYLNRQLYRGELPLPLITFDSKLKSFGHYVPRKVDHRTGQTRPGFSLHPILMKQADTRTLHIELAGLMEHLRQAKVARVNYHDRDYAAGLKERGLQVHREGAPDKETGERVTLSVIPGGRFDKLMAKKGSDGFAFSWGIREAASLTGAAADRDAAETKESKSGRKFKYVCPVEGCDTAFWGKDGQKGGCLAHETPVALVQTD